jgi:hypothetical protein
MTPAIKRLKKGALRNSIFDFDFSRPTDGFERRIVFLSRSLGF